MASRGSTLTHRYAVLYIFHNKTSDEVVESVKKLFLKMQYLYFRLYCGRVHFRIGVRAHVNVHIHVHVRFHVHVHVNEHQLKLKQDMDVDMNMAMNMDMSMENDMDINVNLTLAPGFLPRVKLCTIIPGAESI
jgi:hypothetical protein